MISIGESAWLSHIYRIRSERWCISLNRSKRFNINTADTPDRTMLKFKFEQGCYLVVVNTTDVTCVAGIINQSDVEKW